MDYELVRLNKHEDFRWRCGVWKDCQMKSYQASRAHDQKLHETTIGYPGLSV
jgi:hypothetical protein